MVNLDVARTIAHNVSNYTFKQCSEYVDAYMFESENCDDDGNGIVIIKKETGEAIGLTDYILETYRDLEDDLLCVHIV